MVWRAGRQRFAEEGIEGLLRDKIPSAWHSARAAAGQACMPWSERTLREPPGAVTHWTGRAMAKAMGLYAANDPAHMGCP